MGGAGGRGEGPLRVPGGGGLTLTAPLQMAHGSSGPALAAALLCRVDLLPRLFCLASLLRAMAPPDPLICCALPGGLSPSDRPFAASLLFPCGLRGWG